MRMICKDCYQVYDSKLISPKDGEYICPLSNCGGSLDTIDELLLPTLIMLNEKGYLPKYSSLGHCHPLSEIPWVDTYIGFDEICAPDFENLPKGFEIEKKSDTVVICKTHDTDNEKTLFFSLLDTAKDLYLWAESLNDGLLASLVKTNR